MSDLYEILGVAKDATKEEIKAAYRKLARKYHPDREGGDKERFQELQRAYMTLYDNRARKKYDETGEDGGTIRPTMTQLAYENLAALFTGVLTENINNIHKLDIMDFMRSQVNSVMAKPEASKKKAEKRVAQLQTVSKKLRRKSKGRRKHPPIMENVIAEQIRMTRNEISILKEDIKMYKLMIDLLDDYDYEFDAPIERFDQNRRLTAEELRRMDKILGA